VVSVPVPDRKLVYDVIPLSVKFVHTIENVYNIEHNKQPPFRRARIIIVSPVKRDTEMPKPERLGNKSPLAG
jgi:hypothetical protein